MFVGWTLLGSLARISRVWGEATGLSEGRGTAPRPPLRPDTPGPHPAGAPVGLRRLVVVPVYNEEPSVLGVLEEVRRHAREADVVVIDDGSTDGTPRLLAQVPGIQVLRHPVNQGYGQALMDGFAYALRHGYHQLVTIDCDQQHEPALIPHVFQKLDEGWDVVSGSRYLGAVSEGEVPPDRLAINREFTDRIRRLTGYRITDAFCGFKGYRVASLGELHLSEPGYGFPLQVWVEAWRHGLRVSEVAVPRIYKPNFERRFGSGLDDPARRRRYYLQVLCRSLACARCATEQRAAPRGLECLR